ncbi:MAG: CTP--2,3-di-O-geranylgeranyl-sn-glycero-1-phosphate cytidyltransferase [Candidatus Pacearchaeota archaeon]
MGEHFKIPIFHFLWRKQEKNRLGGEVYFIIGIIITLSIFDFRIALAAVLMTTLGDMAAALFGIAFGKHYIKKTKKTWEGTSAEFLVDLIIAFFLLDSWVIAVPMALMATIVETFLSHMDDNLTIPIFSGFVGQCLKLILK